MTDKSTDAGPAVLALIPARGGSKGIPGKNLALLDGRPLIAWAVEVALEAGVFQEVLVSTDSPEIAQEAEAWGARAPFLRPPELAGDRTPTFPVVTHALEWLEKTQGRRFDQVMLLQPTGPLRTVGDVRAALELLAANPEADGVVSVGRLEEPHPWKVMKIVDGWLRPFMDEIEPGQAFTRQEAPRAYFLNGAIYLVRIPEMLARGTVVSERFLPLIMPPERSINIDTPLDLISAEALIQSRRARAGGTT